MGSGNAHSNFPPSLLSAEVQRSALWKGFLAAVSLSLSSYFFLLTIDIMCVYNCMQKRVGSFRNKLPPFSQYSVSVVHCVYFSLSLLLFFFALRSNYSRYNCIDRYSFGSFWPGKCFKGTGCYTKSLDLEYN